MENGGLKRNVIADLAEVHPDVITAAFSASPRIRVEILEAICKALGHTVAEMHEALAEGMHQAPLKSDEATLLDDYRQCSDQAKVLLRGSARLYRQVREPDTP